MGCQLSISEVDRKDDMFHKICGDELKAFKRTIQYMLYINVPWMETLNDIMSYNTSYLLNIKSGPAMARARAPSYIKLHTFC